MFRTLIVVASAAVLALAACGKREADAPSPPAAASRTVSPMALNAQTVDSAQFRPSDFQTESRTPSVLRAQILLDRAKFSPGVIDGKPGENLRQAIAAFEEANGMTVDGELDEAVFARLVEIDGRPALRAYQLTAEDVKGPFEPLPDDMTAQSKLDEMGYESAAEAIAEKFHMTEELLAELNPGVDLTQAGVTITVADRGDDELSAAVALIEVDKAERAVKAYDKSGNLLAFYPATIGSEERPAPEGKLTVTAVSEEPTYTYDPSRLTYKQPGVKGKLTLAAGPNNPVGSVWISLSKPTFGIHGADEPKEIGKAFSHGCIRLTNWDAEELASAVKAGVPVSFIEASAAGLRQAAATGKENAQAPSGVRPAAASTGR